MPWHPINDAKIWVHLNCLVYHVVSCDNWILLRYTWYLTWDSWACTHLPISINVRSKNGLLSLLSTRLTQEYSDSIHWFPNIDLPWIIFFSFFGTDDKSFEKIISPPISCPQRVRGLILFLHRMMIQKVGARKFLIFPIYIWNVVFDL